MVKYMNIERLNEVEEGLKGVSWQLFPEENHVFSEHHMSKRRSKISGEAS